MKNLIQTIVTIAAIGTVTLIHGQQIGSPNPRGNSIDDVYNYESRQKARLNKAKEQIAPNKADLALYKDFLKQPKTGIVRLVIPKKCEIPNEERAKDVDKFAKECPAQFLYGGSNFSFRRKEYAVPPQSDITIKGNLMYSAGTLSQGIMVKLGDVPVNDVSLQSDGVKFLNDFVPAKTVEDADLQSLLSIRGCKMGNIFMQGVLRSRRTTHLHYEWLLTEPIFHGKSKCPRQNETRLWQTFAITPIRS